MWYCIHLVYDELNSLTTVWITIQDIDEATRVAISRVSNLIRVLAAHYIPLDDITIMEAYAWLVEQECSVKDVVLLDEVAEALVSAVMSS